MKKFAQRIGVGVALVLGVTVLGAAPANAETAADSVVPPDAVTLEMNVTGYDEAAATANGFKIVTYPDGSFESVPVTDAAKAIVAEYGSEREYPEEASVPTKAGDAAARKVTVYGNCGSSWIDTANAPGAVNNKYAKTGYTVSAPVTNRAIWVVQITSIGGLPTVSWPGGVATGATWSGIGTFNTAGFGGQAYVTTGSSVILINGKVCGSGSPATGY